MNFFVDDCMDAVMGDIQHTGNVMLRYSAMKIS